MAVGDGEHVVRGPAVVEAVGPNSRHVSFRHLQDVILGEHPPFGDGDRVEGLVVRPGAGRCVEVVLGLVKVVHDDRVPLELGPVHVLGQGEHLAHRVPVVVVGHVLAPVHEREPSLSLRTVLVEVVGVHLLLAAVDLNDRRNERDDVVPDRADEFGLLDGQTVRQLLEHFRATVLGGVHAAREPIDRLRDFVDESLGALLGGRARIGELGHVALVRLDVRDRLLVGDGEKDHLTTLFRFSHRPHGRPR